MSEVIDRPNGDYALADSVAWLKADDGSSRLFDLERSSFGLNESATRMLDGILNGTIHGTIENLAKEFQVDQAMLGADLADLVERLESSGLIVRRGGVRTRTRNLLHRLVGSACHVIFSRIVSGSSSARAEASRTLFVLRIAVKFLSVSELAAVLERSLPAGEPVDRDTAERVVDEVESSIMSSVHGLLLETACKERALCCWFMLRRRRVPAELVIGVTLTPVSGHSWCQYGPRIVGDLIDRCCDFTVIWRH
jgi:hypothetical protein